MLTNVDFIDEGQGLRVFVVFDADHRASTHRVTVGAARLSNLDPKDWNEIGSCVDPTNGVEGIWNVIPGSGIGQSLDPLARPPSS